MHMPNSSHPLKCEREIASWLMSRQQQLKTHAPDPALVWPELAAPNR